MNTYSSKINPIDRQVLTPSKTTWQHRHRAGETTHIKGHLKPAIPNGCVMLEYGLLTLSLPYNSIKISFYHKLNVN